MRVPFIAAWAKPNPENRFQKRLPIALNRIQQQQAAVYDLFPTILELTGIAVPPAHLVDGLPLRSLLSGDADETRHQRFLMHYPHSPHRTNYFTSYRENDWKVVYHYFPEDASDFSHYQLFHLASRPL